jgi:hypothetical protein
MHPPATVEFLGINILFDTTLFATNNDQLRTTNHLLHCVVEEYYVLWALMGVTFQIAFFDDFVCFFKK